MELRRSRVMAYKLSRRAKEDIYVEGVAVFGVPQAEAYHARLQRTCETLSDNPRMARERLEITPPVRLHPYGSHVVVYIIEPDGGIFVVRVRHAREDWLDNPVGDHDE